MTGGTGTTGTTKTGEGDDTMTGGTGTTGTKTGEGDDTMTGGTGTTGTTKTGEGDDTMTGGTGTTGSDPVTGETDKMTGGAYTIYNFDVKKDVLHLADFGFTDGEEVLDAITTSGQSTSGKFYSVVELSSSMKVTIFSEGELTEKNFTIGTGSLPGGKLTSAIETGDLGSIAKVKGLPPGIKMQLETGMRDELPPGLGGGAGDTVLTGTVTDPTKDMSMM